MDLIGPSSKMGSSILVSWTVHNLSGGTKGQFFFEWTICLFIDGGLGDLGD